MDNNLFPQFFNPVEYAIEFEDYEFGYVVKFINTTIWFSFGLN